MPTSGTLVHGETGNALRNVRERATELGGTAQIGRGEAGGNQLDRRVPLER